MRRRFSLRAISIRRQRCRHSGRLSGLWSGRYVRMQLNALQKLPSYGDVIRLEIAYDVTVSCS